MRTKAAGWVVVLGTVALGLAQPVLAQEIGLDYTLPADPEYPCFWKSHDWLEFGGQQPLEATQVLLLKDRQVIEGRIERVKDKFRIHCRYGEVTIPADRVECVCDSLQVVYQHLRKDTDMADPAQRRRLETWCSRNGLLNQALIIHNFGAAAALVDSPSGMATIRIGDSE